MISTFPAIKYVLMVGIGGGVPPKVRLGDVVVSVPTGPYPGVVQWDVGKAESGSQFKRTGALNNPPSSLLTALTKLESEHDLTGSRIPEYLEALKQTWPRLVTKFLRSDSLEDILFYSGYSHVSAGPKDVESALEYDDEESEGCQSCDKSQTIKRKPREMKVHYGLIASGDKVIKDATLRDEISKDLGGSVLCFEMEAAGLMNNFPCIVIRGICDYADSHKNKAWQEHAAAVAAAFAKELLGYIQPIDLEEEHTVKETLESS
jgi:nucleoside phosphorylase